MSSFDEELAKLKTYISQMGGVVEAQLVDAVGAVHRRDDEKGQRVRASDDRVDEYEAEVELFTHRLLALRQPVATDLRCVLAALKIAADLERVGDYAANIAKRASALSNLADVAPTGGIVRMGQLTQALIKDVLDAYCDGNADLAQTAWKKDEEIDEIYTSLFREYLTYMMEDPRNITPCTHLLFVAKNLERVGDHATNIAETVYFMETGERLVGERPKGDDSSFAVVVPPSAS